MVTRIRLVIPLFVALAAGWWLFLPTTAGATQIRVETDRNPVALEESFQLIFSASEAPDDDPDFSPLQQDFDILGQSQSSNISVVNGRYSKTRQWILTLLAKTPGDLTIPAVAFGSDRSPSLPLRVERAAHAALPADSDLFLEVEAEPKNPYVQSQVIYTIRVMRRVDWAGARLTEPAPAGALVQQLGEDRNYSTHRNGLRFEVTERKYAIFPQTSGELTLPALNLDAEVMSAAPRSRFNGFFNRPQTRTRRIRSEPITLTVRPVPESFKGHHWLPAENLRLQQSWSGDLAHVSVGDPLTRTISLRAKGVSAGQLPEIDFGEPRLEAGMDPAASLKRYPDQAVKKEQKQADGLVSVWEQKIALIPSHGGRYHLPAVAIPWWNTQTDRMEVARLPEAVIEAAAASSPAPVAPDPAPVQALPAATMPARTESQRQAYWMWVALALGLGWGLNALYWWRRDKRRRASAPLPAVPSPRQPGAAVRKRLQSACRTGAATAARDALIVWAGQRWPESTPANLGAIGRLCGADLRAELESLNRSLYGARPEDWDGTALWQAFSAEEAPRTKAPKPEPGLEPLYKA